jgi:uncharacterized protein (TIGR01777 family)
MALGAMPLTSGTPAAGPSCRTTSAAFAIPLTVAGVRRPASSPPHCSRRQRLWACAAPLGSIFDSAAAAEDRTRSPRAEGGARLSGMRVVVSGATGMVGRALLRALLADGVACVVVLARDERAAAARFAHNPAVRVLRYDAAASGPLEPPVAHAVDGAHAVVNLAGEPVDSGRWTDARKAVLWESRVAGSARLARAAERSESFCGPFVTASAVGFYGTSESTVFTEESESGQDFLAKLAAAWESAVWRYTRSSETVRTVVLRLGVVLGPDGGAVRKMSTAFRAFLGGVPGGGSQVRHHVRRDHQYPGQCVPFKLQSSLCCLQEVPCKSGIRQYL